MTKVYEDSEFYRDDSHYAISIDANTHDEGNGSTTMRSTVPTLNEYFATTPNPFTEQYNATNVTRVFANVDDAEIINYLGRDPENAKEMISSLMTEKKVENRSGGGDHLTLVGGMGVNYGIMNTIESTSKNAIDLPQLPR